MFNEDGQLVETGGDDVYSASPALLAVAAKFLKDNQITCDAKLDSNMGKLEDALANKQKHSRLNSGERAARQLEQSNDGTGG